MGALTAKGEVGVVTGTDGRTEAEVRIIRLVLIRGLGWLTLVFLGVNWAGSLLDSHRVWIRQKS